MSNLKAIGARLREACRNAVNALMQIRFWPTPTMLPDVEPIQQDDMQSGEPYQALAEKYKDIKYAPVPGRPFFRHVVIPKEYINTMPIWWQSDFRRLLAALKDHHGYDALEHDFQILKRDSRGRFEDFPALKDRLEAVRKADELF